MPPTKETCKLYRHAGPRLGLVVALTLGVCSHLACGAADKELAADGATPDGADPDGTSADSASLDGASFDCRSRPGPLPPALDPTPGGPTMQVGSVLFTKSQELAVFDDLNATITAVDHAAEETEQAPPGAPVFAAPTSLGLVAATPARELYTAELTITPALRSAFESFGALINASDGRGQTTTFRVIGPDDRTRVADTTQFPHRTIGRLERGCTATLIGPRHLVTAGHCVRSSSTQMWHSRVDFSPGRNATEFPFGTFTWRLLVTTTLWAKDPVERPYDFAMIILEEPVGCDLGWLAFTESTESALLGLPVTIVGYPSDLTPRYDQWTVDCPLEQLALDDRLEHQCDTASGTSGASMYHATLDNEYIIYGVHTSYLNPFNKGIFFDNARFQVLESLLTVPQ